MDDIFEEFIEEVEMLLFWAGPIAGDTCDKEAAHIEEENIARVEYLLDKIKHSNKVMN
jgi:hypothetical protein